MKSKIILFVLSFIISPINANVHGESAASDTHDFGSGKPAKLFSKTIRSIDFKLRHMLGRLVHNPFASLDLNYRVIYLG